jgi:Ser/Thr protein kinase RdoA (MazF antagonist)
MTSPPVELDVVESLLREQFDIAAQAQRLTGDRDENFRVHVAQGPGYVFKVLPVGESAVTGDLLPAVLTHIERVAGDLPVPRLVRSRDGHSQIRFTDAGGNTRIASLCTYVPGKLLMSATRSSRQRRACGELLARLAGALRTFEHAACRREVAWDVARVPALASLIPQVPDLPNAAFLQDFVARFSVEITPRLAKLRHQFVHNDFNARNILVDPDDESRVVGIIDFGDAVYTAQAADVAVGVTGQLDTPETANEALREFVAAYCEVEPLRPEELRLLDWLVAGRIVLNCVRTAWLRLQRPKRSEGNPEKRQRRDAGQPAGGHFDAFDASFFGWRVEFAQRLVSQSHLTFENAHVSSCFIHK